MRKIRSSPLLSRLLLPGMLAAQAAMADDWPQWRGPARDGLWQETGIVKKFPEDGLKVRWRAAVGAGYSGVVVAGGRVYVTDSQLQPTSRERVLCFDAKTGAALWTFSYPCNYEGLFYGAGPYATPLIQDGRVYVCGPKGHLHCLDAKTGNVIWKRDRSQEYEAVLPSIGCCSSPLIEGDLLLVMGGGRANGCVTAYHKDTGQEVWMALKERPSASSPIVVDFEGKREAIFWTLDSVTALDPRTGAIHWQLPSRVLNEGAAVTTPVWHHGMLLLICEKTWLLKLVGEEPGVKVLRRTKVPKNVFTTPLFVHDDHYYAADRDDLACFESISGNELWTAPGVSAGHGFAMFQLTANGDSVFILNDEGKLILAHLSPQKYEEIGRTVLLKPTEGAWVPSSNQPKIWAQPAYADRHIFARSDSELVCASLAEDDRDAR